MSPASRRPPLPPRRTTSGGLAAKAAPTPREAQALQRFFAIVEGVKARGLTPEIEQLEALLPDVRDARMHGEMARLLGFYWLRAERWDAALAHSTVAARALPDNSDGDFNAMYALFKLGRFDEAAALGRDALARHGESFVFHNLLSTTLACAGRDDEARHHGSRALALKDALTQGRPGRDLSQVPVPPFDPLRAARNVVSFSLFGAQPKYLDGMLHNARAVPVLYPGWTCRVHVDASVPAAAQQALRDAGAELMQMPPTLPAAVWGTLWRFLVADDPDVDRYLVRDADSIVNLREAVAVNAWLASGRHFHVMRDHVDHSELVLAGMWGGVRGALPPVVATARSFLAAVATRQVQARTADQEFLREVLWPTIRSSALVHDGRFTFGDAVPFPAFATLPGGLHVGAQAKTHLDLGRAAR